jgi:protein-export membrane protein SecD
MKKRNWRWLAVIAALLVVLFVGRFTKGIDIAWWVEFIYKIDFSKYKEIYKTETEYATVTQQAKNIIEANIRKRVNGLGVGDAEIKLQKVWVDDYVVVRIGWLDDLVKAREIIWKTVELEFALPNSLTGNTNKSVRQELAQDILAQVKKNPSVMSEIGDQGSNDIYYFALTWATKAQLPPGLVGATQEISKLASGEVLNLLVEGLLQQADPLMSGSIDVNGFYIIKSLGKVSGQDTPLSDQELISKATIKGYTTADVFGFTRVTTWWDLIGPGIYYNPTSKGINLDLGDLYPGKAAYLMDLYVPLTGNVPVSKLYEAEFITNLEEMGLVKYVDRKRVTADQVPALNELTGLVANTIKVASTGGQYAVIKIYETKDAAKPLYRNIVISWANTKEEATIFIDDIISNDIYNLETIFVKDSNSWLPAQDSEKRILNGAYFKFASVTRDQVGRPSVQIDLDEVGKDIFCKITEQNVQKQMAIFVGGVLVTAPTIQDKICGWSAIINGDYTVDSAKLLADSLNEGALPAKLVQINESKVSATLGENARQGALWATALALILILALMTRRYGLNKAIISLIALLSFILVLVWLLKLMGYALSLSGMAAIILNIGMGVDAAILIYERLNEELKRGLSYTEAVHTAYDRAWPAVFGWQMSTIAIGLLLLFLGSDLFQGFGLVMTLNIIILLLVSVPLIKEMLLKRPQK